MLKAGNGCHYFRGTEAMIAMRTMAYACEKTGFRGDELPWRIMCYEELDECLDSQLIIAAFLSAGIFDGAAGRNLSDLRPHQCIYFFAELIIYHALETT